MGAIPNDAPETLGRAKLNLYLDVLGRRDDGYHDLETLFVSLDWGDTVRVRVSDETSVRDPSDVQIDVVVCGLDGVSVDAVPQDGSNLAVRAARMAIARRKGPWPAHIHIQIDKRIPVGGGLGGGSADAAAVLRALAPPDAQRIAQVLGADVPMALLGGAAVGRGRGDELTPLSDVPSGLEIVLIAPPFGCETARVFAGCAERVRPAPAGGLQTAVEALRAQDPAALRAAHYNALAMSAMRAYPPLLRFASDVERRLGRAPAMTGSGSTLFDIPDRGEAERVVALLAGVPGTRWIAQA